MAIPDPLLKPVSGESLTCSHCLQEEGSKLQSMVRGCAIAASIGEGVAVGDALRAQTDPHSTYSTSSHLHMHVAECFIAEVLAPPERR